MEQTIAFNKTNSKINKFPKNEKVLDKLAKLGMGLMASFLMMAIVVITMMSVGVLAQAKPSVKVPVSRAVSGKVGTGYGGYSQEGYGRKDIAGGAEVCGRNKRGLQVTVAEIERVAALGAAAVRSPRSSTEGRKKGVEQKLPKVVKEGGRITQIVVTNPDEMVGLGLPAKRAEQVAEASKYAVRVLNLRNSQREPVWAPLVTSGVVVNTETDSRGCYAVVARHAVNEVRDMYVNPYDEGDIKNKEDSTHTKRVVEMDYTRKPKGYLVEVEVKNGDATYEKIEGTVIGCGGEGSVMDVYPGYDYCVVRLSKKASFGGVALSPSLARGSQSVADSGDLVSLGFSTQYNKTDLLKPTQKPTLLADPGCSEMESSEQKENSLMGVRTNCHGHDGFSGGPIIRFDQDNQPQLAGILLRGNNGTAASHTREGSQASYTQGTFVRVTSTDEDMGMIETIAYVIAMDLRKGNKGKCE